MEQDSGKCYVANCTYQELSYSDEYKLLRLLDYEEYKGRAIDAIILMCENLLGNSGIETMSRLTALIKTYPKEIPCCLIGIGSYIADTNFDKYKSPKRDVVIREFLDEILMRSVSIGVRRDIDREWLIKWFGYSEKKIDVIVSSDGNTELLNNFLTKNLPGGALLLDDIMKFQKNPKIANPYYMHKREQEIVIGKPYLEIDEEICRLCSDLRIDGMEKKLWVETSVKYKDFLDIEIADPFLLVVLPYAMRTEHDIRLETHASEEFLHNIREILIPQLCAGDERLYKTKICGKTKQYITRGELVICGFSCGVDSFFTLEHYLNTPYISYRPTHLYVGNYLYTNAMDTIYDRVDKVGSELGMKVIKTNTNVNEMLSMPHLTSHFFKMFFGILALRKLIGVYLYSAAYDYTHFQLKNHIDKSTASIELLLVNVINMMGFKVIDSGACDRDIKVQSIAKFPPSYKYLNVCLYPNLERNCGVCDKCVRTLLELDYYDALELYDDCFDVSMYLTQRNTHLRTMIKNRYEDVFFMSIYRKFIRKEPELIRKLEGEIDGGIKKEKIKFNDVSTRKQKIFGLENRDELALYDQIDECIIKNNIGNNLFHMAVYKSLDWSKCIAVNTLSQADIHCIPAANFFSTFAINYLKETTEILRKNPVRTVVVGIGIEKTIELSNKELMKASKEFVEAVIDTGGSVGVRGDLTYHFLRDTLGLKKNISIIGCPSMRYFGYKFHGLEKALPKLDRNSKIAVCFTPYADPHELTAFYDYIWRSYPNSCAIMQDYCEYMMVNNGDPVPDVRVRPLLPSYNQHFMVQQGRCRITPNTMEWIKLLGEFDFVIGSRLHGCIAGILSGVPSLLIALTERQIEVAKFNQIPYINAGIIQRETSLETLYKFALENQDGIDKVYKNNFEIYTDFLRRNDIPVNPDFLRGI